MRRVGFVVVLCLSGCDVEEEDAGRPADAHDPSDTSVEEIEDCSIIGEEGTCVGDVLAWCTDGVPGSVDCLAEGLVCGWHDEIPGYTCVPGPPPPPVPEPAVPMTPGFGYPVGDKVTYPAGGWVVTQVLGHYLDGVGGHLAQDVAGFGEAATASQPVYSIGDGTVLYAGSNASSYVNVVLVRHDMGDGTHVCSFYGHLGSVTVAKGATVARGDQIATVLDWKAKFGPSQSHLHYVILSADLCDASAAASGALVCGYDNTKAATTAVDLATEPGVYTSIGDVCGDERYPGAFVSPSQFIEAHRAP